MSKSIKAVLFDYGGVICRIGYAPVSQTVYDMDDIESDPELSAKFNGIIKRMARGKAKEDEISDLLREYGHTIPEDVEPRWRATINELFFPDPKMLELLRDLKGRGITVALLSNVWPLSEKIIRENGWYAPFDQLTLSCRAGYAKPEKQIYEIALKKLAVPAEEVLFVDDLEWNLEPAKTLGMQTLLAESPEQVSEDVRKMLRL